MKKSQARALNERCICGSSSFCDTSAHRIMQCRNVRADKCQVFETSEVC